MTTPHYTAKDIQRFWAKVKIASDMDTCWEWQGNTYPEGYGQFYCQRRKFRAHRVSWELANSESAGELFVLHSCDNPLCVNPKHLFLGTQKDNMQDMLSKNRQGWKSSNRKPSKPRKYGQDRTGAKLSNAAVSEIRSDAQSGLSQRKIARKHGVSQPLICKILNGDGWKHL